MLASEPKSRPFAHEGSATSSNILQTFIFPDEARADKVRLYVRLWTGPVRLDQGLGLPIGPGTSVDLATFFNAFSHRKWRQLTGLDAVSLSLSGEGEIDISVVTYTSSGAGWEILKQRVVLGVEPVSLALPPLASLTGEILGLSITAPGAPALLRSAAWTTHEAPRRAVSLAAVITTFGRQAAVRKAMASFSTTTCATAPFGKVELFVVDNEGKLEPSTLAHVTVFPNPNLGGAGGFARGLIEAMNAGRFTHALFMDDDAACEPESVWRSMALLAYCQDDRSAVAGAMLHTDRPYDQHEKGAVLHVNGRGRSICSPNHNGADLSDLTTVCSNDPDDRANYGAWWFFAFPLAHTRHMPFPFFVRGDDIDFSLANAFPIVTLNGIATWSDSFGLKLNPVTEYLSCRSWLALAFMHGNKRFARVAFHQAIRAAANLGHRFDYASMDAVLDAIEDAMRGPAFFRDNPAPLVKLKALKQSRPLQQPSRADFNEMEPLPKYKRQRRLLARLSFGGHLRIGSERQTRVFHTPVAWDIRPGRLIGARKSIVGTGLTLDTLTPNRTTFFEGFWRIRQVLWAHRFRLGAVQRRYREEAPAVRTRAYWQRLFAQKGGTQA